MPDTKAEERLFAGRPSAADDRQFVLELLSYGESDPGDYGYE